MWCQCEWRRINGVMHLRLVQQALLSLSFLTANFLKQHCTISADETSSVYLLKTHWLVSLSIFINEIKLFEIWQILHQLKLIGIILGSWLIAISTQCVDSLKWCVKVLHSQLPDHSSQEYWSLMGIINSPGWSARQSISDSEPKKMANVL